MSKNPQRKKVQTGTRMTEQLRSKLIRAARLRGISMNAEIISRLEQSFAVAEREALRESLLHELRLEIHKAKFGVNELVRKEKTFS